MLNVSNPYEDTSRLYDVHINFVAWKAFLSLTKTNVYALLFGARSSQINEVPVVISATS
jgi:hypothetical protein